MAGNTIRSLLVSQEKDVLADWIQGQLAATSLRGDLMKEAELREQSREFLNLFQKAIASGTLDRIDGPAWVPVREFLQTISRSRAS